VTLLLFFGSLFGSFLHIFNYSPSTSLQTPTTATSSAQKEDSDQTQNQLTAIIPNPTSYQIDTDGTNVYVDGTLLQGADPKTFMILNGNFAKDNNSLYDICLGEECNFGPVPGIDAATYVLLPGSTVYAKDKNSFYFGETPISVTATSTFTPIDDCYAKDAVQVYDGAYPIPGADPSTFTPI
jgi:hypothetical protein